MSKLYYGVIAILLVGGFAILHFAKITPPEPEVYTGADLKKFSTEEEFRAYLQTVSEYSNVWSGMGSMGLATRAMAEVAGESPLSTTAPSAGKTVAPDRVSETTVQVPGIDEPDIVKTDGKEIYFSPGYTRVFWERPVGKMMYPSQEGETKIVKAFPLDDLAVEAGIDKTGDLLLNGKILVIFSGQEIYGYDVSNPKSPEKIWSIKMENSITGTRLYNDKIYLVTMNVTDRSHPCPIRPMSVDGAAMTVACREIYHPVDPIPADVTFTAMILDPASGEVEKKVSFVGSSGSSVVYMSEKAIYTTYPHYESIIKYYSNFLKESRDIFPEHVIEKIEKLEGYDISQQSKLLEFQIVFESYLASIDSDERLRIENELADRMVDYDKEHKRELEKTGIVKIGLDDFDVTATGSIPGYPLNQFALDEYNDHLRIATTVGERAGWAPIGRMSRGESANDVYVLDKDLKVQGAVKDLGLKERIYSVRFIEDKGYVVTFRQTDPFYVLDLSDPQKPELKGELKIPGYSSYLQPIGKDKILGIGMEGWQVKISLFDVSSPENPEELDKYILDESWSDVLSTHHAFLLDKKHEIFFLPGGKGGYVFSYKNDNLKLTKAVGEISARRAIYIDDFLYIIGDNKITVLDETSWEKAGEVEL